MQLCNKKEAIERKNENEKSEVEDNKNEVY